MVDSRNLYLNYVSCFVFQTTQAPTESDAQKPQLQANAVAPSGVLPPSDSIGQRAMPPQPVELNVRKQYPHYYVKQFNSFLKEFSTLACYLCDI